MGAYAELQSFVQACVSAVNGKLGSVLARSRLAPGLEAGPDRGALTANRKERTGGRRLSWER